MKDIDLVLSGSGIKFPVFIGAIRALQEDNFNITRIAGTSGGALIAVAVANGLSIDKIEKKILDTEFKIFRDFSLFSLFLRYGIYKGNKLEKWLDELFDYKCFKDLDKECKVIASNLTKNDYLVFGNKETPDVKVSQAIRMSLSIPFVFGYINYLNQVIVDGFITGNYLIDIFDDNKRDTIGLLVKTNELKNIKITFIWDYISNILEAFQRSNENEHIRDADWARTILINTEGYSNINFNLSYTDKEKLIKYGYDAVKLR